MTNNTKQMRAALELLATYPRTPVEEMSAASMRKFARATLDNLASTAQPDQCRADGRCQYAIDHGAEGLGHCPTGKCAQPAGMSSDLKTAKAHAVTQAQIWAQEVRCQHSIVIGILRSLGLPENDWEAERLVAEKFASMSGKPATADDQQAQGWISVKDRLPEVLTGCEHEFIVAVRRAHDGKTYVFSANYLNAKLLLTDDDECPEGGVPFTGWYIERAEDGDYDSAWRPLIDANSGDELTHWQHLPTAPAALSPESKP